MEENNHKINPYRIFGQLHNEGMDYVIESIRDKDIRDTDMPEIVGMISEYLCTVYQRDSKIGKAVNYELVGRILNKYGGLSVEEIINLADIPLSSKTVQVLKDLHNLDLKSSDEAYNEMTRIEKDVLYDDNIPEEEKQYPLVFIAIAQASIEYRDREMSKANSSLWSRFIYKLKKYPWRPDGEGAVGGLVTGGIKGVFAGPAGIAAAAGIGILAGSIGNSVKAIIFPGKNNKVDPEEEKKRTIAQIDKLRQKAKKLGFKKDDEK